MCAATKPRYVMGPPSLQENPARSNNDAPCSNDVNDVPFNDFIIATQTFQFRLNGPHL